MTVAEPQTLSVIESISAGYRALNRRLWVVLIPIVFNLYLAFGAPVSLAPLWGQLRELLAANERLAAEAGGEPLPQTFQLPESLDDADMRQALLLLNFVPVLRGYAWVDGLPAEVRPPIDPQRADIVTVAGIGQLLGLLALLNGVALAVSALFLAQLAAAVAPRGAATPGGALAQAARVALGIGLWALLLVSVTLLLAVPFGIGATVLLLVVPQGVGLLLALWIVGVFWVQIFIGFAIEAIALDRVGPLRAIGNSFQLVRRNFFPTVGLLALAGIIGLGLGMVWQQISTSTPGIVLACIASAYIGTGLAAARMVFYRERKAHLAQRVVPHLK